MSELLTVDNLNVSFRSRDQQSHHAVRDLSLTIGSGDSLGVVGESGCGKSTLLRAMLGILPGNADATGQILFDGVDMVAASEQTRRRLRWEKIAFVPQSAMNAFDPVLTIRSQIVEAMTAHGHDPRTRPEETFEMVGLDPGRLDSYPHQLSGGMRQRAAIAMAIVLEPSLLLADEPTTGLDVIMQDQVLGTIKTLQRELDMAMVLVTHNVAAVNENCTRTTVMYAGEVVEEGATAGVLDDGMHPYTLGLRNSIPTIDGDGTERRISIPGAPPTLNRATSGCAFEPRCPFAVERCRVEIPELRLDGERTHRCHFPERVDEFRTAASDPDVWMPHRVNATSDRREEKHGALTLEGVSVHFPMRRRIIDAVRRASARMLHAVDDLGLTLEPGKVVGIAGESGSGKSTTGRCIAGLEEVTSGTVGIDGNDVASLDRTAQRSFRRRVQMVFQDPFGSLNPRFTVGRTVEEPLRIHRLDDRRAKVIAALERSGLRPAEEFVDRYPHELSGGQRQRVAIARAVVLNPDYLIADEPVSMLDVSVRAGVLELLRKLAVEESIGVLYITHDLSTMQGFCDEITVMYLGRVVEHGPPERVLLDPQHPYTQALVAAAPRMGPADRLRTVLEGEPANAIDPAPGCRFAPRCHHALPKCSNDDPVMAGVGTPTHTAACWLLAEHEPAAVSLTNGS